jgi:hypothetical protein
MAQNWGANFDPNVLQQAGYQWLDMPISQYPSSSVLNNQPATQRAAQRQSSTPQTFPPQTIMSYATTNEDESYFTDNFCLLPEGYFLSETNAVQALNESTTETSPSETSPVSNSSPEPAGSRVQSNTGSRMPEQDLTGQLAPLGRSQIDPIGAEVLHSLARQMQTRAILQTDLTSSMPSDLTEDVTPSCSQKHPQQLAAPTTDEDISDLAVSREAEMTTKRTKYAKADTLSACWESPLCPNHREGGPPPDPSTCGTSCAPLLFAASENSNIDTAIDQSFISIPSMIDLDQTPASPVQVTPQRPNLKRNESSSETVPTGRFFEKPTSRTAEEAGIKLEQPIESATSPDGEATQTDIANRPRRRQPHTQVERKYRESLNTQLEALRRVVPSLQPQGSRSSGQPGGPFDMEDLPTPNKPSKAVVLASATAHIKQLEKDKKNLADENAALRSRIKALQALVKCDDCSLMQYVMNLKVPAQA